MTSIHGRTRRDFARGWNALAPFASALIVVGFGVVTYVGIRRAADANRWVLHTHAVIETNQDLLARLVDAETGERGFLITGDSAYLDPYRGAAADVAAKLRALRQLTVDNASQQARIDTLDGLAKRRLALLQSHITTRLRAGVDSVRAGFVAERGGKPMMDSARSLIAGIDDEEQGLLVARTASRRTQELAGLLILVAGSAIAALLAMAISSTLSAAASTEARLGDEVRTRAAALDAANRQLQDQAVEMEMLNEELRATNEKLEERSAEAEEANRIKAEFLANMSHDLRTPLNAVVGYVDLLEGGVRGPLNEAQRTDVQRIKRSAGHLLGLINEVLDFAKIEAGHLQLHASDVWVEEVLEELDPLVHPQAKAKGITFTAESDPGLVVRADREKLDQVLVNLVGNAIKFTPAGGRVEIECRGEGVWVRADVRDTGAGIPADQLDAVFEPFVQISRQPHSRESSGVGLGLSIGRRLARAMGGDLTATSKLGRGSTFSLRLPRADDGSQARSTRAT